MRIEPVDEEPSSPQAYEGYPPAGYPRGRFVLFLVLVAALLIFIGVVERLSLQAGEEPAMQESALEGDVSMKLSYAYRRWMSSLPANRGLEQRIEAFEEAQRVSAIALYRRAVAEKPSPENLRRLIIVQYPSERAAAIEQLAVRERLDLHTRRGLQGEAAMWRDIYLSRRTLLPAQVRAYAARIRSLDLGWYEHLALADLFRRAGMPGAAEKARLAAAGSAAWTVGSLLSLLALLGLLGLIGVVLLRWYVLRKGGQRAEAAVREPAGYVRELRAGLLLEAFVVYLAVTVVTQMTAGVIAGARMAVVGEASPTAEALFTACVYVLSGLLALLYLAYRLRSVGWSWRLVGFTTRNPFRDILWGIGGYAAALPLLLIAGVISRFVGRFVESPTNPVIPLFAETETLVGRAILFALAVLIAPFVEELFFRGVLFNSFRAKWSVAAGIVLSAAVFASVHPLPVQFLPIFVLGSVFATLFHERGSLLSSAVAHGLNNCVLFVLILILTGG